MELAREVVLVLAVSFGTALIIGTPVGLMVLGM